jgi:hypothetical protein
LPPRPVRSRLTALFHDLTSALKFEIGYDAFIGYGLIYVNAGFRDL